MCAVASDWKIERLCQTRHLHEDCNASTIGDIGLWIRHSASGNIVLELPKRAQVFAGCDWYSAGSNDACVTRNIVRNDRFLKPGQVAGLQRAGGANGLLDCPLHVGIRHEWKTISQVLAHRLHAADIRREIRSTDLHLDGTKALSQIIVRL